MEELYELLRYPAGQETAPAAAAAGVEAAGAPGDTGVGVPDAAAEAGEPPDERPAEDEAPAADAATEFEDAKALGATLRRLVFLLLMLKLGNLLTRT